MIMKPLFDICPMFLIAPKKIQRWIPANCTGHWRFIATYIFQPIQESCKCCYPSNGMERKNQIFQKSNSKIFGWDEQPYWMTSAFRETSIGDFFMLSALSVTETVTLRPYRSLDRWMFSMKGSQIIAYNFIFLFNWSCNNVTPGKSLLQVLQRINLPFSSFSQYPLLDRICSRPNHEHGPFSRCEKVFFKIGFDCEII